MLYMDVEDIQFTACQIHNNSKMEKLSENSYQFVYIKISAF